MNKIFCGNPVFLEISCILHRAVCFDKVGLAINFWALLARNCCWAKVARPG